VRRVNRALIVAVALALGGCKALSENCNDPQVYQTAGSMALLKVPEGLTAPSTKNTLTIPPEARDYQPRKRGQACLDAPPQYFAEPLTPPASGKKHQPIEQHRWWWHP
jgi:uncharacterized lipoprotein